MKIVRRCLLLGAVFATALAIQSNVSAQVPGNCGSGFPYPGFFGNYSSPYATGRIPTPPYFAIHPPVYYSAPVPRTYGYSPYAYPGSVRTPEIEIEKVAVIENPYYEGKPAKNISLRTASKASQQLEVINPFVISNETKTALAAHSD